MKITKHYFKRRCCIGCCGFFGLFGRVLKVVLPNVSPVSVAIIFRGQHSVLWCSLLGSGVLLVCLPYLIQAIYHLALGFILHA